MPSLTLLSLPDAILQRLCDSFLSLEHIARLHATCRRMATMRHSFISNTDTDADTLAHHWPATENSALEFEYYDDEESFLPVSTCLTGLKDLKITFSPVDEGETSFPEWLFSFLSTLPGNLESLKVVSLSEDPFSMPVMRHLKHLSLNLYSYYPFDESMLLAGAMQEMHSLQSLALSTDDDVEEVSGLMFAGPDLLACQHLRSIKLALVEPEFVLCIPSAELQAYVGEDYNLKRWAATSHCLRYEDRAMDERGDPTLIFAPTCQVLTSLQVDLLHSGLDKTEAPVKISANMPCLKSLVVFATNLFMKLGKDVKLETLELECENVLCLGISDVQCLSQSLRMCTLDALGIACFELAALMQAMSAQGVDTVKKKRWDDSSRIRFPKMLMGCSSALVHCCDWSPCWRCKRRKCGYED